MNDDIVPNSGEYFTNGVYYPDPPKERVEADTTQQAIKAASYPILPEIADWFEAQIAMADSLDNIETKSMTINGVKYNRTVSVEAQVLACQILKEKLTEVYHEFQEWQEDK